MMNATFVKRRTASGPVTFDVPRRLDPTLLPENLRAPAFYFTDQIHRRWLRWDFDDKGFVHLKYDYLTNIVPRRRYLKARERLEELQVVECDHLAVNGKKAYGFRLRPPYQETHSVVCDDRRISRNILRRREQALSRRLPVHWWLEEKLAEVDFDFERALSIIQRLRPDEGSILSTPEYQTLLVEACRKLVRSSKYLIVDDYGRVHTPITSLAKQLRCCLTVRGEHLIGLDLRNSQPLFAGMVATRYYTTSRANRRRMNTRQFQPNARATYTQHQCTGNGPTPTRPCITTAKRSKYTEKIGKNDSRDPCASAEFWPGDVLAYLSLCERGELYESLMDADDDRDGVKRALFTAFYGKPWHRNSIGERFAQRFPLIDAMLRGLKADDYRRAAWIMQHEESSLFIGRICRRIMRERPEVPIYTIHDSILTTRPFVSLVEDVIRDEFEQIGIRPAFEQEEYNEMID